MKPVDMFRYVNEWNGSIICDYTTLAVRAFCSTYPAIASHVCDGVTRKLCLTHRRCPTCCKCVRDVKNTFLPSDDTDILPPVMQTLIAPYINTAVADKWSNSVMNDLTAKINSVDPTSGLGVLHALLAASVDNESFCKQLLEIGVDPDQEYVYFPSHKLNKTAGLSEQNRLDLDGGTALHFAVYFKKPKCFQVLAEVSGSLTAKTSNGKDVETLTDGSVEFLELIVSKFSFCVVCVKICVNIFIVAL